MANNYFAFKQFTVFQDRAAMKVTTDGCLFGAWVSDQNQGSAPENWLDIGAGTGLLSLMLAQKQLGAHVQAVELEPGAATQCGENFIASPFVERLRAIQADIVDWNSATAFDQIMVNPPFYENQLKGPKNEKNQAHHEDGLTLPTLLNQIERLLKPTGDFYILLPASRQEYFMDIASKAGWYLQKLVLVKQTPNHNVFRCFMRFIKQKVTSYATENLVIKEGMEYTPEFLRLMKDYYLNL